MNITFFTSRAFFVPQANNIRFKIFIQRCPHYTYKPNLVNKF